MAQPKQQRPGDFTGRQKARLAAEHAEQIAQRDNELSMMEAAEREAAEHRVTDYTEGSAPVILDNVEDVSRANEELLLDQDDIAVREAPTRTIRVNDDLDQVTIGAGNHYSFRAGEKYRVPAHVAAHLEEKGYVWH